MNPLSIPWGQKPKVEKKPPVPSFIGLRNEAVRDSTDSQAFVTVVVRGVQGTPNGEYKLEWVNGSPLKHYLTRLKLVDVAYRSSVRDSTNPQAGRLSMHYIPKSGSKIELGNPAISSALQYQRSNHDAESIAQRMGGGARFVDVPLHRK